MEIYERHFLGASPPDQRIHGVRRPPPPLWLNSAPCDLSAACCAFCNSSLHTMLSYHMRLSLTGLIARDMVKGTHQIRFLSGRYAELTDRHVLAGH